jgi:repressor LexA
MVAGYKIKEYRKEKGYTLKQLSEYTGLSLSFISDIEHNRSNPSLDNLKKLADALDVSINNLISEDNKSENTDSYSFLNLKNLDSLSRFAKYFKSKIKEKQITEAELSKLSGVSQTTLSRIGSATQNLNPEILRKLANALNENMEDFMGAAGFIVVYNGRNLKMITKFREHFIDFLNYLKIDYIESLANINQVSKEEIIRLLDYLIKNFKFLSYEKQNEIYEIFQTKGDIKISPDLFELAHKPLINTIPLTNEHIIELPVYGEVRAGVGGYALQEYLGTKQWLAKNGDFKDVFMLRIKGDSMYPRFFPGDFAVVRPQRDVDSGDPAIVMVDEEEGLIKRVKKVPNGIILHSDNQLYEDREFYDEEANRVRIVGRVFDIKPGRV